ncbi:hypothetical protein M8818_005035 [Zalaria obscura]|uniref:Uncharacterized protein n=1 Tax=Zalaria obscura TaxID=2024903 RepID=A0ACC3SAV2_9PEZI
MFGAGTLLRTSRGQKGEKSADLVRVHRADEIRDRVGWDRWAVMVFAVLSGGDYGKGLQSVGPVNAEKLVRWRGGRLGALMAEMRNDRYGRMMWREELLIALTELRCWVDVPPDFPRELIVRKYRDPKVSTPEQLVELRGLRGGWNKDVNELRLRAFLSERFNFWAKGYIRNVLPMLLARRLSRTQPGAESQNTVLDIQLVHKRRRGGQESPDQDQAKERTISFNPLALTTLDLTFQPEEEDWTRLATKQGPFDPAARVEIELLECVLVNGMGTAWLSEQLSKIPEKASKSSKGKAAASGPPADGISTERENARSQATTPAKGKRKAAEMGADVIATGELKRKRGSELSSPATPVSATPARQVSATPARPVFKLPSAYSAQNAIWQSENAPPTQSPQLPTPMHANTTQGNGPRIPRPSAQASPPSETPTKQNDFPTHIRNARTVFLDRVDAGFMQSPVGAAKDTMPRSRPALPTPRLSLSGDGLAQLPPPASYEEAWRREYEERRTVARECIDLLGNDEGTPSGGKEGGKEKEVVVIDLTDD